METKGKTATYTTISSLEEGLRTLGYFRDSHNLPKTKVKRYRQINYTPEAAVGLLVHSCVSDFPEGIFYTDGNIIYTRNRPEKMVDMDTRIERLVVQEHLVIEILDANVIDLDIYYTGSGDLVFNLFEASFAGLSKDTLYAQTTKKLCEKYHDFIVAEKQKIAERIQLNKELLDRVMNMIKNDIECSHIYTTLLNNLSEYGYQCA